MPNNLIAALADDFFKKFEKLDPSTERFKISIYAYDMAKKHKLSWECESKLVKEILHIAEMRKVNQTEIEKQINALVGIWLSYSHAYQEPFPSLS